MKPATTCDFDRFCDNYLDKVKCVHNAGFWYIDLSLYAVKEKQIELEKFLFFMGSQILSTYEVYER